jgi:hypothetical protein
MNYRYAWRLSPAGGFSLATAEVGFSEGQFVGTPLDQCNLSEIDPFVGYTASDLDFLTLGDDAQAVWEEGGVPVVDWDEDGVSNATPYVLQIVDDRSITSCSNPSGTSLLRDHDDYNFISACMTLPISARPTDPPSWCEW